jgi:hypothetical protein
MSDGGGGVGVSQVGVWRKGGCPHRGKCCFAHARARHPQAERQGARGVLCSLGAGNMDIDSRVWLPSYLCTLEGGRREHDRHSRSEMEEVRRVLWGVALSPHCPRRNRDLLRQ